MNRRNQILTALAVLQIVLVAAVVWLETRPASGAEVGPLLGEDFSADDVASVTVTDGEGNTIALARQNDEWVLPDADDFPAQGNTVTELLETLAGLTRQPLIASNTSSHEQLQVAEDDFVRRIGVELADGTQQTLYVGSSPRANAAHVRVEGQNEVYLARDLPTWNYTAEATSWIDALYLNVNRETIVGFTLENENGTFEFQKNDRGEWEMADVPEGETLAPNNVSSVLGSVATIRIRRPLGTELQPAYGLEDPAAVATIETESEEGSKTYTVEIGAQLDDTSYAVKSSESAYYVAVSKASLENVVTHTLEDFLQQPATPTPGAQ